MGEPNVTATTRHAAIVVRYFMPRLRPGRGGSGRARDRRQMMAPTMKATVQPPTTASDIQFTCPYSAKRISSTACVNGLNWQT